MTKQHKADGERRKAIEQLREWIKPGDTVYTILDSVSRSGMSRQIRVVVPYVRREKGPLIAQHNADTCPGRPCSSDCDHVEYGPDVETIDHLHPNYSVAKAIQARQAKRGDGIIMGGCGMDMGFALVYELSAVLYGARLHADVYKADATTENADGSGRLLTRDGAPEGKVWVGGYKCLGKGKCPSNYHRNHRDTIRCEGTRRRNADDSETGFMCYKPDRYGRYKAPEDWPTGDPVDIGDGQTLQGPLLACLLDGGEERHEYTVCPTCKGVGHLPNPKGPERFDLVHTDGYALRHKWL